MRSIGRSAELSPIIDHHRIAQISKRQPAPNNQAKADPKNRAEDTQDDFCIPIHW